MKGSGHFMDPEVRKEGSGPGSVWKSTGTESESEERGLSKGFPSSPISTGT